MPKGTLLLAEPTSVNLEAIQVDAGLYWTLTQRGKYRKRQVDHGIFKARRTKGTTGSFTNSLTTSNIKTKPILTAVEETIFNRIIASWQHFVEARRSYWENCLELEVFSPAYSKKTLYAEQNYAITHQQNPWIPKYFQSDKTVNVAVHKGTPLESFTYPPLWKQLLRPCSFMRYKFPFSDDCFLLGTRSTGLGQ